MTRKVAYIMMLVTILLSSCKSDYAEYLTRELESGAIQDSLIFDMYMGETKKQFYDRCWDLNKQKLVHQGTGANVKYSVPPDTNHPERGPITLYFYGVFDKDEVMRGMDYTYHYNGWSPWNENLGADSLMQAVKVILKDNYGGNDWLDIHLDDIDKTASVKIDGNRQMLMYTIDQRRVKVKIRDLNNKL